MQVAMGGPVAMPVIMAVPVAMVPVFMAIAVIRAVAVPDKPSMILISEGTATRTG